MNPRPEDMNPADVARMVAEAPAFVMTKAPCPECRKIMRQDAPHYFFCTRCRKLFEEITAELGLRK
jgi:tRNA(Ile2) C34 agmatinyltransferase TiaS